MFSKLSRIQRALVKAFYYQGLIYGFISFKVNNKTKCFEKSRVHQFISWIMTIFMVINLLVVTKFGLTAYLASSQNTKLAVPILSFILTCLFSFYSYYFMSKNVHQIICIGNEILKCILMVKGERFKLNIFTSSLLFDSLFLQPILFIIYFMYAILYIIQKTYALVIPFLAFHPARVISVLICLAIQIQSFLLSQITHERSDPKNYFILETAAKSSKLLESYIFAFLIVFFVGVASNGFTVISMVVTSFLLNSSLEFITFVAHSCYLMIDIFYMWVMLKACQTLKKEVNISKNFYLMSE